MFKQLGQMAGLLQQLPKLKAEMERLQERLAQVIAVGDAGAGMVQVRVNGKLEVLSCSISDEALSGAAPAIVTSTGRAMGGTTGRPWTCHQSRSR